MPNRIRGLDGFRAIAIFLVLATHFQLWIKLGVTDPRVLAVIQGRYGVRPFFVMSGFLITWIMIREHTKTGTISLRKFFMRRSIRIFPLYFLFLGVLYLLTQMGYTRIKDCTFNYVATYTTNFAPATCNSPATSHLWSLAVEEHFYLFWPLIFLLGKRFAFVFAVAFATLSATSGHVVLDYFPEASLTRWTFPAAAPIAYGAIAAFVCNTDWVRRIFGPSWYAPIVRILLVLGIISPAFMDSMTLQYATIALVVLYFYHNQNSVVVKALELKPIVWIGVMSYGLYVWHGMFMGTGPYRFSGSKIPFDQDIGLIITLIVTPIVYYGFERPILRLKDRFAWDKRKPGDPKPGEMAARPVQIAD